jgi:hypothetical protein
MPQISARSVADWDNPAAECREKAEAAGNPQDREFFAEMERRWLFSREQL